MVSPALDSGSRRNVGDRYRKTVRREKIRARSDTAGFCQLTPLSFFTPRHLPARHRGGRLRRQRSGLPAAAVLRARSGPARRLGGRRDEGRPGRTRRPPARPGRAQLRAHGCGTHPARFHRTRAVVWFEYIDTAPPVPYACTRYTQVPDVTVSAKVVTFGPSAATRLKARLFFADAPRS